MQLKNLFEDWTAYQESKDTLWNFVPTFQDFVAVLNEKCIWSIKDNEAGGQWDPFLADHPEYNNYVCLTSHPLKVSEEYTRPFGLAFNRSFIENIPESRLEPFSQIMLKTSKDRHVYTPETKPQRFQTLSKVKDLTFDGIADLGDGNYIIQLHPWEARKFRDKEIYDVLYKWLKQAADQDKTNLYYEFKNSSWSSQYTELKPNADGKEVYQLKGGQPLKLSKTPTNKFATLAGCGPFKYFGITALAGTHGPSLLTCIRETGLAKDITDLNRLYSALKIDTTLAISNDGNASSKVNQTIHLEPNAAAKLNSIFNEYEWRLYQKKGKDLNFSFEDIKNIVIPNKIVLSKKSNSDKNKVATEFSFESDFKTIFDGTKNYSERNIAIDNMLRKYNGVANKKNSSSEQDVVSFKVLFKLLNRIIEKNPEIKNKVYFYDFDTEYSTYVPEQATKEKETHLTSPSNVDMNRYLISSDDSKISNIRLTHVDKYKENGRSYPDQDFLVGDLQLGVGLYPTRFGTETLIFGKDAEGEKYLLVADKNKQSAGFLELVGGAIHGSPESISSESNLRKYAHDSVLKETGLDLKVNYLRCGLYMSEVGIAQRWIINHVNNADQYFLSYYYLFVAEVPWVIEPKLLDNTDNGGELCRWLPVSGLEGTAFPQRYSVLLPLIKSDKLTFTPSDGTLKRCLAKYKVNPPNTKFHIPTENGFPVRYSVEEWADKKFTVGNKKEKSFLDIIGSKNDGKKSGISIYKLNKLDNDDPEDRYLLILTFKKNGNYSNSNCSIFRVKDGWLGSRGMLIDNIGDFKIENNILKPLNPLVKK